MVDSLEVSISNGMMKRRKRQGDDKHISCVLSVRPRSLRYDPDCVAAFLYVPDFAAALVESRQFLVTTHELLLETP